MDERPRMGRLATGRRRRVAAGIGCVVVVTAALGIWIDWWGGTGGRTAGVLATVAVGSGASNVAVDARIGRAFVVDPVDGTLSVLDARRGLLVATVPVAATPQLVVADDRRGHVFVTAPGELDMLDARTGHVLRRQVLPSVARAVALDRRRGRLILAMIGPVRGTVAVYDTGNGSLLALYAAAGSLTDVTVDDTTGRAYVTSDTQATPAAFTVIDISTGRTASLPTGARDLRAVAVAPSLHRAYVLAGRPGSATGQLDIVDTRPLGGQLLRTMSLPGVPQVIAVDTQRGHVVVADGSDGTVRIYDTRGALLHIVAGVALSPALAFDPGTGHVLAADADGTGIAVIDAMTGVLLRTVDTGGLPLSIAVDEQGRRAVVVSVPRPSWRVRRSFLYGLGAAVRRLLGRGRRPSTYAPGTAGGTVTVIDLAR